MKEEAIELNEEIFQEAIDFFDDIIDNSGRPLVLIPETMTAINALKERQRKNEE